MVKWVGCDLFLLIYLSTGAVEWESTCFAATILYNATPVVTAEQVQFVYLEAYLSLVVYM